MNDINQIRKAINVILIIICIISLVLIFFVNKIEAKLYGMFLILYIIGYIKFIRK